MPPTATLSTESESSDDEVENEDLAGILTLRQLRDAQDDYWHEKELNTDINELERTRRQFLHNVRFLSTIDILTDQECSIHGEKRMEYMKECINILKALNHQYAAERCPLINRCFKHVETTKFLESAIQGIIHKLLAKLTPPIDEEFAFASKCKPHIIQELNCLLKKAQTDITIENFRSISVCPSAQTIVRNRQTNMPAREIIGAYESKLKYLWSRFLFMMEDMNGSLRQAIEEKDSPDIRSGVTIYKNVIVGDPALHEKQGLILRAVKFGSFDRSSDEKQLKYGALIVLSSNNFTDSEQWIFAKIEDHDSVDKGAIFVDVFHGVEQLNNRTTAYTMIESPAYYNAYQYVMKGIQEFAISRERIPFQNYIVDVNHKSMRQPQYLLNDYMFDFGVLTKPKNTKLKNMKSRIVDSRNSRSWPTKEELKLDQSQYDALKIAFSNELTIVQGPPGTGKTFFGSNLVKLLLCNERNYNPGFNQPILVVCFTNHALDQFLEALVKFCEEWRTVSSAVKRPSICRVGARGESKTLEKHNLRSHMFKARPSAEKNAFRAAKKKKTAIGGALAAIENLIGETNHSVVSFHELNKYPLDDDALSGIPKHFFNFENEEKYAEWMLGLETHLVLEFVNDDPELSVNVYETAFGVYNNLLCEGCTEFVPTSTLEWLALKYSAIVVEGLPALNGQIYVGRTLKYLSDTTNVFVKNTWTDEEETHAEWPTLSTVNHVCVTTRLPLKHSLALLHRAYYKISIAFAIVHMDKSAPVPPASSKGFAFNPCAPSVRESDDVDTNCVTEAQTENERRQTVELDLRDAVELSKKTPVRNDTNDECSMVAWLAVAAPKINMQPAVLPGPNRMVEIKTPYDLKLGERWRWYRQWAALLRVKLQERRVPIEKKFVTAMQDVQECRRIMQKTIMERSMIIGMTTTGAAMHNKTLQEIQPSIVIMEEAAEVGEAHTITSLTAGCQHFIMIGDHQQLQPSTSDYQLGKDYNLNISLFERLIKNGFPNVQLTQQHRMRPMIADTLMTHFYSRLTNAPSTAGREDIRGVGTNIAFIDHRSYEQTSKETTSRSNKREVLLAIALCKHFLLQGYKGEKITVLVTYGEQLDKMNKAMKKLYKTMPQSKFILIRTVDNYQGEENQIIILSLVRSNEFNGIGFLKSPNRICVALSRARDGLYVIGNMKCLVNGQQTDGSEGTKMWSCLRRRLKKEQMVSKTLSIKCTKHGKLQTIENPADFARLSPLGGCTEMCETLLECGHTCKLQCHGDMSLHKAKCEQVCNERLTNEQLCKKSCWEECEDEDSSDDDDSLLMSSQPSQVKCTRTCGHLCPKPCVGKCHKMICDVIVKVPSACGDSSHKVVIACGMIGREKMWKCNVSTSKLMECKVHSKNFPCHQSVDGYPCRRVTTGKCGHKVMCGQECGECSVGRLCRKTEDLSI